MSPTATSREPQNDDEPMNVDVVNQTQHVHRDKGNGKCNGTQRWRQSQAKKPRQNPLQNTKVSRHEENLEKLDTRGSNVGRRVVEPRNSVEECSNEEDASCTMNVREVAGQCGTETCR